MGSGLRVGSAPPAAARPSAIADSLAQGWPQSKAWASLFPSRPPSPPTSSSGLFPSSAGLLGLGAALPLRARRAWGEKRCTQEG